MDGWVLGEVKKRGRGDDDTFFRFSFLTFMVASVGGIPSSILMLESPLYPPPMN